MTTVSRRNLLSLGAALGLTGALAPAGAAWSWAPSGSIAGTGTGVDPRWVWDDDLDRIIAGVIDAGQVPAVNQAYAQWVDNSDAVPAGLPPELRAFLQQSTQLPAWADMAKLKRAADYNRRKDTYFLVLYGVGGGIMSTTIPREAKSVYWSKGGADMQDRAAKTFTFGYDMAQLGGFEPQGQFLVTANKTRTVHAAVRHLLPQSPQWRAVADERIPISNHDILVTFHSTGTFAHKMLKQWGAAGSAADQEAFLHSWQVALHLLGVHDEYIPATWADAHAQSDQILTPILNPTFEGRELAEVLLGLTAQVDLGVTRGFLNEFVRYLLGDQIGDWLALKRDYAAKALIRTGWPAYVGFREGTILLMPLNYYLFDQFVRALAMAFLNRGADGQTTPITLPDINRATS
jgi:hypothetical protein